MPLAACQPVFRLETPHNVALADKQPVAPCRKDFAGLIGILFAVLSIFTQPALADNASEVAGENEQYRALNKSIQPYSRQEIVALDVGDEHSFTLNNGSQRVIRLVSVEEHRDDVVKLIRRAEVDVTIDGKAVQLLCAPYVMPTVVDGLRILADTTSGFLRIPGRVQFSLWDATDPVVDADRLCFPLPRYRLFSHGMQAYNEVVHLGSRDGNPGGPSFYHNYGVDFAGYEGRQEVVSCVDGLVVAPGPNDRDNGDLIVREEAGFFWHYGHLDVILPNVKRGARVKKGDPVGLVGKKGASGNFAHLHVGTYLSQADLEARRSNCMLNLYPWLVTLYHRQAGGPFALARPHHVVCTGEEVRFDAANCLIGNGPALSYRWEFHDGQVVRQSRATKVFDKPGTYMAALWTEADNGSRDVDFCKVKVFTNASPESVVPTIFMTHVPAARIVVDQPVLFRCWVQGSNSRGMSISFDDGTVIEPYLSDQELEHSFKTPGIHAVTAQATIDGMPITQKQKLHVLPR